MARRERGAVAADRDDEVDALEVLAVEVLAADHLEARHARAPQLGEAVLHALLVRLEAIAQALPAHSLRRAALLLQARVLLVRRLLDHDEEPLVHHGGITGRRLTR